ncbi:unnamed protein product [Nesidiocoris tenuis]|uniref:Membrane insertase YidC/Oxa/ALB C-terminal domain-containing protein n=1 Tax=Nesidiocoris tenuis TaxID=355587 RepID=A0A6H5G8U9_9HEMI|nr:unnamed protein product [Nesidiocoris tenuis]
MVLGLKEVELLLDPITGLPHGEFEWLPWLGYRVNGSIGIVLKSRIGTELQKKLFLIHIYSESLPAGSVHEQVSVCPLPTLERPLGCKRNPRQQLVPRIRCTKGLGRKISENKHSKRSAGVSDVLNTCSILTGYQDRSRRDTSCRTFDHDQRSLQFFPSAGREKEKEHLRRASARERSSFHPEHPFTRYTLNTLTPFRRREPPTDFNPLPVCTNMAAVSSPQPDFLLPAPCPLCSLVYLSLLLTPRRRLTAAPPSPRCASIPDHPDYQPHYADPPHHQHSRPFPPQFSLYPSGVHSGRLLDKAARRSKGSVNGTAAAGEGQMGVGRARKMTNIALKKKRLNTPVMFWMEVFKPSVCSEWLNKMSVQEIGDGIAEFGQIFHATYEIRTHYSHVKKKWDELVIKNNCHPFKATVTLWVQIPTWVFFSVALRNLAYMLPFEDAAAQLTYLQLSVGGLLWIPNLTQPDDTFILPLILGLTNLAIIEMQAVRKISEPTRLQRYILNFFRIFSVALIPLASTVPSILCLYWTTSSILGLGQNLLFLSNRLRAICRIPDTPSSFEHPYRQLWADICYRTSKFYRK